MNTPENAPPEFPAGGSEWWEVTPGERFTIRTSVGQIGGVHTMMEVIAGPRNGVPLHVHANEEEHFVVLEGRVHLITGDQRSDLSAGESATVKRGTPHACCNIPDSAVRMLIIFSPGYCTGGRAAATPSGPFRRR